jgi:serine/threonine-protein kinase HipA
MADNLQQRIGLEREAFESLYGLYPALQRIEKVVMQQCRRVMKR